MPPIQRISDLAEAREHQCKADIENRRKWARDEAEWARDEMVETVKPQSRENNHMLFIAAGLFWVACGLILLGAALERTFGLP